MARTPPWRSRLPRILRVSRRGQTRFALAFAGFANFYLAGLHVVENLDTPSLEVAARDHAGLEFASNRAKTACYRLAPDPWNPIG